MPKFSFLKGARAKKLLHMGHLLIEFLRKVLKAVGKTAHHVVEKVNHGLHGAGKGKSAAKAFKGSKAASAKTAGMASKGAGSTLGTGATAGGAGVSTSFTAVASLLVVSTLALGGVGAYSVMNHQNPVIVLQESVSIPTIVLPKISQQFQKNPFSAGQQAFLKSFQPEVEQAIMTEQPSNNQQTSSQTTQNQQNSPQTGSTEKSNSNTPYQDQSISYQVPENPQVKK